MYFFLFCAWLAPTYSLVLTLNNNSRKVFPYSPIQIMSPLLFLLIASCLFLLNCLSFRAIKFFLFLIKTLFFRTVNRKIYAESRVFICQHNTQFSLLLTSCITVLHVTIHEPIFDPSLVTTAHGLH